jgi:hypothetical protein
MRNCFYDCLQLLVARWGLLGPLINTGQHFCRSWAKNKPPIENDTPGDRSVQAKVEGGQNGASTRPAGRLRPGGR